MFAQSSKKKTPTHKSDSPYCTGHPRNCSHPTGLEGEEDTQKLKTRTGRGKPSSTHLSCQAHWLWRRLWILGVLVNCVRLGAKKISFVKSASFRSPLWQDILICMPQQQYANMQHSIGAYSMAYRGAYRCLSLWAKKTSPPQSECPRGLQRLKVRTYCARLDALKNGKWPIPWKPRC